MSVLEAKNITKIYEAVRGGTSTKALNGISITVNKGEFVGIMGPSGSGKSTFLNIFSGIDKPSSGEVVIEDTPLNSLNKNDLAMFRREKMGFIFQDFNLLDSLTVKENIMLPLILDKKAVKLMENTADSLMTMLEINDIAHKYPYTISGGQQQRVAIARALSNEPVIVFADEPTGNLDSKSSNAVMTYFEKINSERKDTILMVTHDAFAASFCKKIIFIKDGMIYTEIIRHENRKEFFNRILDCLAVIGGEANDI
jgi:putative ABC transport system ATP-binding protein